MSFDRILGGIVIIATLAFVAGMVGLAYAHQTHPAPFYWWPPAWWPF